MNSRSPYDCKCQISPDMFILNPGIIHSNFISSPSKVFKPKIFLYGAINSIRFITPMTVGFVWFFRNREYPETVILIGKTLLIGWNSGNPVSRPTHIYLKSCIFQGCCSAILLILSDVIYLYLHHQTCRKTYF